MLPSVFTKKTLYQESVLRRPRTPPCAGVDILQYEELAIVGEELLRIIIYDIRRPPSSTTH